MTNTKKSRRLRAGVAAAIMLFAGVAEAGKFNFNPYASGQYLYDSNVYKFSSQVAQVTGTASTADRIQRYAAGIDADYTWQKHKLYGTIEGRRFLFQDFTQLDHNEYALGVGFDGDILSNTTGLVDFRQERRMASFEDRRSTQLTMERDQTGRGALNITVTPEWHVLTGARLRYLQSPLPAAPALPQPPPGAAARNASPDFAVHETAYNAGVQYGIENVNNPKDATPWLVGVMLEHQTVSFGGVTPQPPTPPGVVRDNFDGYRLLSLEGTAQYTIPKLSAFDGKLGITQFTQSGTSSAQLTGEIGYTRALSAVTELNAHVFRRIVPYVATGDATTNTGFSLGAKWNPLRDLTVLGNYAYASSSFGGSSGFAPENSGRGDKVQQATLSVAYPLYRYFTVKLFSTYDNRDSSLVFNNFSDKIFGAELSFRWL